MRIGNNTNCEAADFPLVNNMDDHIDDPSSAMMRYYRTKPDISDLINIEDVWNTYDVCKSTGSRAPHMDDKLEVLCQQ
ncbi:hypothetical protein DPMN_063236 [Dreissena polymorpha]|uniref:Uncharacterized protein n=1 Tax=Dreissena polymorpha TaxID=45954 RepID=A0A9D4CAZ7_DREPO|nr:hypothetical protein DPMN_063236 [Dreissena polymorpha]